MKASQGLGKVTGPALRQRRQDLVKLLPPAGEALRGCLVERYVTLAPGRTTGGIFPAEHVEQVRRWIENYQRLKADLEGISEINRELLRCEQNALRVRKRKGA